MTLAKYGLRAMDYDVMPMLSDAMKHRYSEIITELIEISRSS